MSSSSRAGENASQVELELYFIIAKFLGAGPCQEASKVLLEELEHHQLLPKRIDWEGREHFRSYDNLVSLYKHIKNDHLLRICQRLPPLLEREVKPSVGGVMSLLGAGSLSALRTEEDVKHIRWKSEIHSTLRHQRPLMPPANLAHPPHLAHVLEGRSLCGQQRTDHAMPSRMFSRMSQLSRSLGHLSAVYCLCFDRTGDYFFTGADDHLIKVWSTTSGRLIATLRGHSAEITDMAVNHDNSMLAAGSCDKLVRVWCLGSMAPLAVLHSHSGMVTSLQFCPYQRGVTRYLASTGGDGCVCFWKWNVQTKVFDPKPIKFIERSRAGAQMLCSSFSPGGVFLTTGNSDHVVRVYCLSGPLIEKICELESHTDQVDSIQYANHCSRFVSGSKDGCARVWRYERQEWRCLVLDTNKTLQNGLMVPCDDELQLLTKRRVTMVCWNADDTRLITAVSDCTLKVWDSSTGELLQILKSHQDEVFVLEHCPTDPRIILSAGHDGHIILWDISDGHLIKKYFNNIQGQGHGAVFDCKWAPDGQSFSATDSHGFIMYFGFGSNERFQQLPEEMFFHTDYRPLVRDGNNYVLDEQTQQPPHLMPPPFLVDIDGNPHPPRYQRLVPGRERCDENQLVPQLAMLPNGDREVLDDVPQVAVAQILGPFDLPAPPEAPPASEEAPPPSDAGPASEEGPPSPAPPSPAPPSPAPPSPAPAVSPEVEYDENGDVRIIDRMIEHLQQEQDQRIAAAGGQPLLSPRIREGPMSPLSPPPIRAPRRSREVEGVRQPQGPVPVSQQATDRDLARSSQRVIVRPLGVGLLRSNMRWTAHMSDSESKAFTTERKRKPLVSEFDLSDSSASGSVVRRKKGRNEERTVNRLTARALYDTEEEETPGGTTEEIEEEEAVAAEEAMDNMWKSSSDGESSDYSDWMEDAGHNLQPPQRRSTRKPKRRRFSSEDDSDADSTDTDADDTPRSDVSDDDEPSTSRRTTAKKKAPPKRKKAAAKQTHKERKQQQKKQKLLKMQGPVTELPEQFKPPEWLTENVPKKSPYFPQMGDEVMYFRQGHELYLKAVKHRKVYDVDIARNQPWHKISHLREMELVKVIGLKYEIKPPRLVCLKLALIDTETGGLCPGRFTVKYHDMPDVIDFIVLKQTFDSAKQRKWKVSDHFRSLIDDAWWFGQIEAQTPLDEHYPDSLFQCFTVHWANGEIEKMSPWDLEPCSEEAMPRHRDASVPVTQAERESMLYVPNESDWPEAGREEECRRISQAFGRIMELSIAEHFLAPVDLNAFPTYAIIVAYPVDLTLIKERLDKHFFRRINSIQYDVRHIESNAVLFNEPTSRIVKLAKQVTELCLRVINDSDCYDPMPLYNEITKEAEFSLHPVVMERKRVRESNASSEELDVAGPSITAGTSRNPSKRRRIDVSQGTGAWKAQCRQLLDIIYDCDDSAVFRNPVSAVDYPDYYEIITSPMDLSTVKEHLQCGHYDTPGSFAKDVKLVFNNSKQYNTNKRSRIYAMTLRLGAMFDDQIKDIITNWKSSMKLRRTNRRTKASVKGSSKSRSTTSKMAVSPGPSSASASTPGSAGSRAHSRAGHSSTGLSTSGGSSGPRRPKRAARAAARQRMVDSDHDDEDEDASGDESTPQPSRWSTRRTQKRRPIFRDDEEEDLLEEEDLDEDGRPRERPKSPKVEDDSDSDYHMSTSRRSKPTPRKQPSPAATVAKSAKVKRVLNKPPSKKKKLSNGQRSYSTRCSTGSLQRKNYKRVFSEETSEHHASDEDEDDNDEEDNSSATSEEEDTNVVSKRPPLLRKNRSQGKATSGKSRAGGKRAVSSESEDNGEEEHEDSEDHDSDKTEDLEEVVVARKSRTRGLPPVNGNNHDHSSEAEREEKSDSEEDADSDSSVDNTKRQSKVETDDSATEIENNDDDDEDEDDEEMSPPKPTRSTRSSGRSRRRHASSDEEMEYDSRYSTRNRGQRTVLYREESDDNEGNSDEEPRSVSSRGRVRKITPRARGIFS